MEQQEPSVERDRDAAGRLLRLVARLRGKGGCPWDRKQTPRTLSVYLIEEVYELVEAIAADDAAAIGEELGDVLFQVMFLVYLFQERGLLDFEAVVSRNIDKMVHRHPHVFGTAKIETSDQVKQRWREIKQQEKNGMQGSLMDSVPSGMPALMRAYRISERAAGVGFDWDSLAGVLAQTEAEWSEFKAEITPVSGSRDSNFENKELEFGDILFTLVNVGRLAGIHPETALARATEKFIRRFKQMERTVEKQGTALDRLPRDVLEKIWVDVKQREALPEKE